MDNNTEYRIADLAELGRRYEKQGIFSRMKTLATGLAKPRWTREYKLARIELQRLAAPLCAVVVVSLFAVTLAVVTAVKATDGFCRDPIAVVPPETDHVEPLEDPPETDIDMTTDIDIEIAVDVPVPSAPVETPAPPSPKTGGEPNKVVSAPSPVQMTAIAGTVKMRGLGDGDGGGFGTQLDGGPGGRRPDTEGCLIGTIIDVKSDAEGKARAEYSADGTYWKDVRSLVEGNFSAEAMSKFFVAPKRVALTHLWVPPQGAANGPAAFGVQDTVKPSGFVVYYKGDMRSLTGGGRYRFWGYFDDFMMVRVNGKTVMDSAWTTGGLEPGKMTGWTTSDRRAVGTVKCPQGGGKMAPGDWFSVDGKHPVSLELLVGERPGGMVGGLLLIEQEGVEYAKNADGTRILPIFASRPLSPARRDALESDVVYRMSADSPRFNAKPVKVAEFKGDVTVDVSI